MTKLTPATLALLLLAGCTVGPNFLRPDPPAAESFIAPDEDKIADQQVALGKRIDGDWWHLFGSTELDGIVRQAIDGNRTVAAAQANLSQAQALVEAAGGALLPQVDLAAGASRQKVSLAAFGLNGAGFGPANGSLKPFSLFTLGPSVSYSLDLFGGERRTVEKRVAQADNMAYLLDAAYLTTSGNAVISAITLASLQAQVTEVEAILVEDERTVTLTRTARAAGAVGDVDVLSAESQLANDRTLLAPLRQQQSVARHALAVLIGAAPGNFRAPDFALDRLTLPRDLPLSLPSELARQRPDILAAEADLHAASAEIGIATARLYPNITLTASVTQESNDIGQLFTGPANVYNLAANLMAPIFHGGTLSAEKRAAADAFQYSLATYQQTVLQALAQIADQLQALAHDSDQLVAERRALEASDASLRLTRVSYGAGNIGVLQVIDAERSYQQARLGLVRAQAQQLFDTAQLFVALGGGWWDAAPAGAGTAPAIQ